MSFRRFTQLSLVTKIALIVAALIVLTAAAVGGGAVLQIRGELAEQVMQRQNNSLRTLAVLVHKRLPDTKFEIDAQGRVGRVVMTAIPDFADHDMIDEVGRVTGETATLFRWQEAEQDFFRRTTNIVNAEGKRAVGTALGKTSAAYAPVTQGRTYLGEAVILGNAYYTVYHPVHDPAGKVIGILYAGVLKSRIEAFADAIALNMLITSAIAILIGAGIAVLVMRGMMKPLPRLTDYTNRLAQNDLSVQIGDQERQDEIGALARAVAIFKRNAEEKLALEAAQEQERQRFAADRDAQEQRFEQAIGRVVLAAADGDLSQRVETAELTGVLQRVGSAVNDLLNRTDGAMTAVISVTSAMAEGDLRSKIDQRFRGRFELLAQNVNNMADRLRDFAGRLAESAETVRIASAEISTGSQDLAQRTESQAASIEETAASMHEITTTVKQNADNAQAASQLAVVARDTAEKGGNVVADAVKAVTQIEDSARKISDIVGLIDEIAFQTNLLALNASVEAARAGEAGKGFAVVAQEVRALAQRSANASKEIKGLIANSNAQVKTGASLVQQTGSSLTEIVGAVKKVADIVAEIATASREQATGLDQINTAVGSMDEMTQRNGALVEETSASAQSLADQGRQLAELVGFFRLDRDEYRMAKAA
ncbi:MAG: Cache 3/Cache 2 fusion domain-containing protein [Alphaproteobacteria bacterium]|nr:Cache 3/Cache 2 fusion domain-containing protein [Alphaproteobacteria bacterium]